MISFECDYLEGCHPKILEAFTSTNMEQEPGYGFDSFSECAKEKIREACGCRDASIYFLHGGTQTNQLIIDSLLTSYQGVMAADTGHIAVHEAGAIEFVGHKVLALPNHLGKVDVNEVSEYLSTFYADGNHEHMVFPGMLYISYPTEYGTLYSKEELEALYRVCRDYEIPFFIDGARLGYGLAASGLSLKEIASLCDVFYIGGTKIGALCGEAVVFPKGDEPKHFMTLMKQHGALAAKGRLYGVQFDVLFTDDLYMKISQHAIDMAMKVKQIFIEHGYQFFLDSDTNQQFVIVENSMLEKIGSQVRYGFWEKYDEEHTVIRFATSWATTQESVDRLEEIIRGL